MSLVGALSKRATKNRAYPKGNQFKKTSLVGALSKRATKNRAHRKGQT